ncbi:MAG: hypothetical protein JXA10_08215 [Anaerolineae bacterium]|nr:hypothetical protein [Anaerolineae bacterium]
MTDKILAPIYYLLWVSGLVINSVPQFVYLMILVVVSMFLSLKIVSGLRSNVPRQPVMYDQPNSTTRYQHWRILCAYAHGSWFSKNRLATEARELILSILAFEQGVKLAEAEAMVQAGALDIPPVLQEMIVSKHIPHASTNRLPGILSWLSGLVRWRKTDSDPYIDHFLTELINFVEHHLEMTPHARNEFES